MSIENNFMSYETSALAAKLGFTQHTTGHQEYYVYYEDVDKLGHLGYQHLHGDDPVKAPLELLQKWLREEKDIIVFVDFDPEYGWNWNIYITSDGSVIKGKKMFSQEYHNALEMGLFLALEILETIEKVKNQNDK